MNDDCPPRRPFQFRLRTLFVIVTSLALACGWGVDHWRLTRERDDALQGEHTWMKEAEEWRLNSEELQDKFNKCVQELVRREQELADKR